MDRRFICTACGVKWFIPWTRPQLADLTDCGACGGDLIPFVAGRSEGHYAAPEVTDAEAPHTGG